MTEDKRTVEGALRQAIFALTDRLSLESGSDAAAIATSIADLTNELRLGRAQSALAWDDEPDEVQS